MAKTQYLAYNVNISDKTLAESLAAQYPKGVVRAPYNPVGPGGMAVEAANLMTAAGLTVTSPLPVLNEGDPFVSNSLTSPWFTNSSTFPRDVATFTISSGWWIFGSSTTFRWVAHFIYAPSPDGAAVPGAEATIAAPIPVRSFIDGMEILHSGEGANTPGRGFSRAGAILADGNGFAYRNGGSSTLYRSHTFPSGVTQAYAWTRVYVRLRTLPNFTTTIVHLEGFGASGGGARLGVDATGKLAMFVSNGSTVSLISATTSQLVIGHRHRLDILTYIGDDGFGVATCNCYYFFDGGLIGTTTNNPGGLVGNAKISEIRLGQTTSSFTSTLEIDFDDWRCAMVPDDKLFRKPAYNPATPYVITDLVSYTGVRPTGVPMPQIGFEMFRAVQGSTGQWPRNQTTGAMNTAYWIKVTDSVDWILGSRVVLLDNTALAQSTNWTIADYRVVSAPLTLTTTTGGATSGTSAAVLAAATDAVTRLANVRGAVGWAAVNVGVESNKAAGADGSVGYKIGAAAPVYVAIPSESTSGGWSTALYSPAGLQAAEAFAAVEAHYKKGADANTSRVRCLLACVDVLGVFSACDLPPGSTADPSPLPRGTHNAPYPDTPWFYQGTAPLSPVVIKAGTYVGNATGQDLLFSAPVHWLAIRPVTGDAGGCRYFSAASSLQRATGMGGGQDLGPGYARRDPSFVPASSTADQQMQFLFPIAGSDTQVNANGVTYQYVAFCDPGARFLLTGATYHEAASGLLPVTDALEVSDFLAECGFVWRFDNSLSSTDELWFKGTGHTTAQASKSATGTPVASAVSFGAGTLTWDTGLVDTTARYGTAYALWRTADGNGDPNQAKVWARGTYVGDGNATRTVPFTPAPGLRPLYVSVQPHNSTAIHRDPSHTGTTSSVMSNGSSNASTGITAGALDGFVVGSALNANGITYSWFALIGSATAGNNGWSINGEFTPVASDSPVDPGWDIPPDLDLPFPPGTDEGGGEEPAPDDEPDLSTACVAATQRIVNIALSRIGVSKVIADLVAENTMEAAIARLHIKPDVDAVLADFPWPFATRYASLALVAGSEAVPANVDWVYSYRAPVDLVMARRLGGQLYERRAWDPNPITFRAGSDATGALIYSNAAATSAVPLVLEYTARVSCPASTGSPLFKDALAWRVAASLAMPLARDPQRQASCLAMYERVLAQAERVAANEMQQDPRGDADWIAGR